MQLENLLKKFASDLVSQACSSVRRAHLTHYETAGDEAVRGRIQALFDRLLVSVEKRDLGPMLDHAREVAHERFSSGYDLGEVQVAFNVLEEAVWLRILRELPPAQFGEALGTVGTVLGAGKDALARAYVAQAARAHAPAIDEAQLSAGAV